MLFSEKEKYLLSIPLKRKESLKGERESLCTLVHDA
jgi:hypothetical protein